MNHEARKVVTSLIGVAMLLLLTGLIPTAMIASAATLNGVTGVDDTLQRSTENDDINTSDGLAYRTRNMVFI
jgi:hypothetical protein